MSNEVDREKRNTEHYYKVEIEVSSSNIVFLASGSKFKALGIAF